MIKAKIQSIITALGRYGTDDEIVRKVKDNKKKQLRSLTLIACYSQLVLLVAICIKSIINRYDIVLILSVLQFVFVAFVSVKALKKNELYMGYTSVYGFVLIAMIAEVFDLSRGNFMEQRLLFTDTVLLLMIVLSGIFISPRHVLILGGLTIMRLVAIQSFITLPFYQKALMHTLGLFIFVSVSLFLAYRKVFIQTSLEDVKNDLIMQKNMQLNELVRMRQEMISMIMHDIRNPLNNILFITKETESGQEVAEQVKTLLKLSNDFIDVYKMEEKRLPLNLTYQSAESTIQAAIRQVHYLLKQKNNSVHLHFTACVYLDADHKLLERVFVNLLTNAARFALPNSVISIDCAFNKADVIFRITNNGKSPSPDQIEKVFEGYFTSKEEGSKGIGLQFCRLVIKEHNGSIGMTSKYPENGCTTWFRMPLNREAGSSGQKSLHAAVKIEITEAEKQIIQPFLAELRQFKTYETGKIIQSLQQIPSTGLVAVEEWKTRVMDAAVAENNDYYQSLLID